MGAPIADYCGDTDLHSLTLLNLASGESASRNLTGQAQTF
jgi:hypothetical protein